MTRRPAAGDPADRVGRLYDRHAASLFRYAVMILADRAAAADAIHDVFVSILQRDRSIEHVEPYLRRAVRNECFSRLRLQQYAAPDPKWSILEVAEAGVAPIERIALERAVAALPADQREVVHLKAFEGMTFQEIADLTGDSINTVASRYRYALDRMRQHLGDSR